MTVEQGSKYQQGKGWPAGEFLAGKSMRWQLWHSGLGGPVLASWEVMIKEGTSPLGSVLGSPSVELHSWLSSLGWPCLRINSHKPLCSAFWSVLRTSLILCLLLEHAGKSSLEKHQQWPTCGPAIYYLFYVQHQTPYPSALNLRRWKIQCGAKCSLCGNSRPTVAHVLNGCPMALEQGHYTWHHDCVLPTINLCSKMSHPH